MIAIESFKRFRVIDILIIIFIAIIWALINFLIDKYLDQQFSFIFSLLILIIFMSFTVHLVRKAGSATLFYIFSALFSATMFDIGLFGTDKLISFLIAGLLFELMFLIFKLEIHNMQIDIILGSAVSAMSIPITSAILLSMSVAQDMISSMINIIFTSFFIGLSGAILSFLIWYNFKKLKLVLKYEYMQ